MDVKVLRSPDFSGSIALKSGQEMPLSKNAAAHEKIMESDLADLKKESQETDRQKYERLVQELEAERKKIQLLKSEQEQKQKILDEERIVYRKQIEDDIHREARNKYEGEFKAEKQRLLDLILSITEEKSRKLEELTDDIHSVVYEAVCKIIGKTAVNKDVVLETVRSVIKHCQDRMQMTIHLSPTDYELVKDSKDYLAKGLNNRIDLIADDHVVYGGCIVEMEAGSVDGRLEQQLRSLLELLLLQRAVSENK